MKRSEKLRTLKSKFNKYDTFTFENTGLRDTVFEDCEFYGIEFKLLKLSSKKNIAPMFLNCKFIEGRSFIPIVSNIQTDYSQVSQTLKDKYFIKINVPYLFEIKKTNGNTIEYSENKHEIKPNIIYDGCIFKRHRFIQNNDNYHKNTLFINCKFYGMHKDGLASQSSFYNNKLEEVIFKNCSFTDTGLNDTRLKNCLFDNCKFNNVTFYNCHLGNLGPNEFNNCEFKLCDFTGGVLHNYLHPINTTIIRNNCSFDSCCFSKTLVCGFKFNYDSKFNQPSKLLKITNCDFVCLNFFGTNFDNCDLEGTKFACRTTCISSFSWFGNIFLSHQGLYPIYKANDITSAIKGILGDEINEFNETNKTIKES